MNPADSLREHYLSVKPVLRGWLHMVAAPIAGTAAVLLAILAPSDLRIPLVLFALTTILLFSVSAVYHRGRFSPRVTGMLQRWDHANIFLVIAGSATPFAVALLGPGPARSLLAVLWLGAVGGAAVRIAWIQAPRWLFVPMYLALGWASAMFLPGFLRSDILTDTRHAWVLGLILLGGLCTRSAPACSRSGGPTRHPSGSASMRCSTPSPSGAGPPTSLPPHWS